MPSGSGNAGVSTKTTRRESWNVHRTCVISAVQGDNNSVVPSDVLFLTSSSLSPAAVFINLSAVWEWHFLMHTAIHTHCTLPCSSWPNNAGVERVLVQKFDKWVVNTHTITMSSGDRFSNGSRLVKKLRMWVRISEPIVSILTMADQSYPELLFLHSLAFYTTCVPH